MKLKFKKEYLAGLLLLLGGAYLISRRKPEPETPEEIVEEVTRLVNRYFSMKKPRNPAKILATRSVAPAAREALKGRIVSVEDEGGVIRTEKDGWRYTVYTVEGEEGRKVSSVTVHTPYKLGGKPWSFSVREGWVAGL